jgi:superfamily I DNA/RNA helicase
MTFTLFLTRQFEDDLRRLQKVPGLQPKLDRCIRYLQEDPRKHGEMLGTTPLKRAKKLDVLKSDVDGGYRLAWRYEGPNALLLFRVGEHDLIDEYGTFHTPEIVREIRPAVPTAPVPGTKESPTADGVARKARCIFEHWLPMHLRLVGVPEDQVRVVKKITEIDELFDLPLPEYAVKNLADAYLLDDWESTRVFDSSTIFYRATADQLEAYCRGEIKRLLLNLAKDQERFVTIATGGPMLIRGPAGSGKTTVGVYRAWEQTKKVRLFAEHPRVLFVTYTETLARVVEQMYEEHYGPDAAERVEVWVLRDWLQCYLEGKPGARPLAKTAQLLDAIGQAISSARQQFPDSPLVRSRKEGGQGRGGGFFAAEIADVIKGRNLRAWPEYSKAQRIGRQTGLGEAARQFVWAVYLEYQRQLDEKGLFDYMDLSLFGGECLQRDVSFEPYDAVVVDEAQDLRPVELRTAALLAGGPKAHNLTLLADPAQSIYYKGIPWKEGGVRIAARRSFVLRGNHRNTQQILAAARSLVRHGVSDDPKEEVAPPEATGRRGPRPTVALCSNLDLQNRFVIKTIEQLCGTMQCRLGDIAVLSRGRDRVKYMKGILDRSGLLTVHFRDEEFDIFENNVKLITLNSAKGLEFPVVFLVDLHEGELPRTLHTDDEDELEAELRAERRLLYVGMTRAAQRLFLVCERKRVSRFVEEIDPETVRVVHYEGEPVPASEEPDWLPF